MKRKRNKPGGKVNATGRNERPQQFFMLTYSMARSAAFRSLSGAALKVLVELHCRYDGANNGRLHLSYREAERLLDLGRGTIQRALSELIKKGFIRQTRQGSKHCRLASEWLCTDLSIVKGEPAPNDWRRFQPTPNTKHGCPDGTMNAATVSVTEPSGGDCTATETKTGQKTPVDGSISETLIHSTMRSVENGAALRSKIRDLACVGEPWKATL